MTDTNALRRADTVKLLYQACTNTGSIQPHYLPVEYLLNGKPLTVALVGRSTAGKTHLLAAMISEIEASALEPYGIEVRAANADWHTAFLRKRVNPLRSKKTLEATPETEFAQFEDALLLTVNGVTRPVAFFDVSGENLMRTDATTRFLAGVDALIFVVDPMRAVRLPAAQAHRERQRLGAVEMSDPTFGIVLNRVRRSEGRVVPVAAMALAKSDLLRFDAPVDRWFRADPGDGPRREEWARESRDAFAFLAAHADRAWLRPMSECDKITAHFVSATGVGHPPGRPGGRPRRVLEPLLSVLESCETFKDAAIRFEGGVR